MRSFRSTALVLLLAAPFAAEARIDLVTLPQSDRTEVTIYNSQDLTLVRETRRLPFTEGSNIVQFSWAGTKIDPTSVRLHLGNAPGLELLETVYPANTRDLVIWEIVAEESTEADVEIRYFVSGFNWNPRYVVVADETETSLALQQFFRIDNKSGESVEDANVRFVVGEVNLVEKILAIIAKWNPVVTRGAIAGSVGSAATSNLFRFDGALDLDASIQTLDFRNTDYTVSSGDVWKLKNGAAEILKKAVSEYHLFTVDGTQDLRDGWATELPTPQITDIPFDLAYEFDAQKFGPQIVKLYKLKNNEEHDLGTDPLPDGTFYVYRNDGRGSIAFEGKTEHDYIPIGDDVELNLGNDGLLTYKTVYRKMERFDVEIKGDEVVGWKEFQDITLTISNFRNRTVPVKITDTFPGDWDVEACTMEPERVDRQTLRWELEAEPNSTTTIDLRLLTRYGTHANSN